MKIFLVTLFTAMTMGINPGELTEVKTKAEAEKNWDKKVVLVGTYETMMLPKSARPNSELISSPRIIIKIDGDEIALDRGEKGIRGDEEKKKFLGKKVKVTGTLRKFATLWGDGTESSIIMNCITDIKSVEPAE